MAIDCMTRTVSRSFFSFCRYPGITSLRAGASALTQEDGEGCLTLISRWLFQRPAFRFMT